MSQAGAGFDQIPFYREYLEHILKPRVIRGLEEIRAGLQERVWAELLARLAEDQRPGVAQDAASIQQLRGVLEQGLRLQLSVSLNASMANGNGAASNGEAPSDLERTGEGFPDNPLARAVGGVRRIAR